MAEEAEARKSLDEFPDEAREDINGLLYLGSLEDEFEVFGHHFVLRTLKADEELTAGVLTKEYQETMTQAKAWAWANVCQALESVDYEKDFCPPIGPDQMANARGRFRYCTSNWYWLLGKELFDRLLILNARQQTAANAIRDLSPRSLANYSPSQDSTIGQDDSESQPEIQRLMEEDSTESSTPS